MRCSKCQIDHNATSVDCPPSSKPMTDHAQREIIEVGDSNFFIDVLWEKAVGVCIGEQCGRQFISRERFDSVIRPAITQAHAAGRREGMEEAAELVDHWHISKGGYSEMAWQIRAKAKEAGNE